MNTLTPLIQQYMAGRLALGSYGPKSQRVVTPRLRSLASHFGKRPLHHLNRRAIEAWLGNLDHLAVNSRAAYLASVRGFTSWLYTDGLLKSDPCAGVPPIRRPKPVPRALETHQVRAVLDQATNHRDRAIVWLMVGMGLRRMEVAGLRWDHYDERSGYLHVHGKGGRQRLLPVPAEVAGALALVPGRTSAGPVIRNLFTGTAVTPDLVGYVMSRLMWDAGVKNAAYDGRSGHALRHTAASDVLDVCGDLRVVQELLGHENLSTTAIYLRRIGADRMRPALEGRGYLPAA